MVEGHWGFEAGTIIYHLSECRKIFENQKELESGIRSGFAVLLACFFLNYKPHNT
jgi:hypothetical protein